MIMVFRVSLIFVIVLSLCVPFAAASEITPEEIASYSEGIIDETYPEDILEDPEDTTSSQDAPVNVYTVEDPLYISLVDPQDPQGDLLEPVSDDGDLVDPYGVSLLADAPITSADTTGLKAVLLDILGDYEPILFTYQYGTNSVGREVFQDDVWLCSFWMLMLLTFCVFRLIGGWLTRKK